MQWIRSVRAAMLAALGFGEGGGAMVLLFVDEALPVVSEERPHRQETWGIWRDWC